MAIKKIEIRDKASNYADLLYPKTSTDMVEGLQAKLDEKANVHNHPYAATSHTHTASQITGLPTSLPANGGNADTVGGISATTIYHTGKKPTITEIGAAPSGFGLGSACAGLPGGDWDLATQTGWYMGVGSKNAPDASWWMGEVIVHTGDWIIQEIRNFTSSPCMIMRRQKNNGAWGAWEKQATRTEIDSLKSSVGSGKNAIASAITAKGVNATGSEDFASLANKIGQIGALTATNKQNIMDLVLSGLYYNIHNDSRGTDYFTAKGLLGYIANASSGTVFSKASYKYVICENTVTGGKLVNRAEFINDNTVFVYRVDSDITISTNNSTTYTMTHAQYERFFTL